MQTFLPFSDFSASAAVLDRMRLGKQRVETLQLTKSLLVPGAGWGQHPASKMWVGHLDWLFKYQEAICYEWHNVRGYKDTCLDKTRDLIDQYGSWEETDKPWFVGNETFHASHQSNLLRKLPEHYSQFFTVSDNLDYIWSPV